MLGMNGKKSRNASRADIMWLKKSGLNVKEIFNQQISKEREMLMEFM